MVRKLLPLVIIVIVWLIFSKPFFLDGKIPYPSDYQLNHYSLWNSYEKFWGPVKNPSMPDVVGQLMPWKHLTIDSWKNLSIPLWNPYSFSGNPNLANYQSSVFSITNLFFFVFSFNDAWGFAVLIQPLLAGIFMYLFIRSLKLSQTAALISGVSFMFSGFIVVWMSWTSLSLAISFLPLALFSIEKYFELKKVVFLILLFLSIPLSFFSGHFQISLYFLIFVFAYIFFKFHETKDRNMLLNTLIFFGLGILSASSQILPSIELYLNAPRSLIFQKIEAIPLSYLPTLIAPDFYGNPVTRNDFFGHYIEWAGFFGVIPFLLAIYALIHKSKKISFFAAVFFISILLALNTPITNILVYLKIPVLSTSSLSRILGIFIFSGVILTAFGLDFLRRDLGHKSFKKISIWILIITSIFIMLWLIVAIKRSDSVFYSIAVRNLILPSGIFFGFVAGLIFAAISKKLIPFFLFVLALLTVFDVLRFAKKWQPFGSKELAFIQTPIIQKLSSLDNSYRTLGPFEAEGSVYYKIPSTDGYDPLYIGRYGEFIKSLSDGKIKPPDRLGTKLPADAKYFPKILDFIGVKYVLQKKSDVGKSWAFPFKKYPKDKFKLIYEDKQFLIYENSYVYPRAFLVGEYKIVSNNQEIIDNILDKDFNLRKVAVVEKDPNIRQVTNLNGTADMKSYQANKVIINAQAERDSLLVLTDNFYPGWKAKVNGKTTEVLRTDYTFRAVAIPKGKSTVEFYYDPLSFRLGFVLSALSIIGLSVLLVKKLYTIDIWAQGKSKTAKSATKSSVKIVTGKPIK